MSEQNLTREERASSALGSFNSYKRHVTRAINECNNALKALKASPSQKSSDHLWGTVQKMDNMLAKAEEAVDVLCKNDPLQVDTVHDQLDKESERVNKKRQEATEALAGISIPLTPIPVQATELNRPLSVKINDALKPFTLKRDHDPMDLDSWKRGFKVYYSSSKMENARLEEQQAYFTACLDKKLKIDINLKIVNTTPILGNESCMSILEEEFRRMYPLFSRRVAFHSMNQSQNESKLDWINKLRLGDQSKIHEMTSDDIYVMRIVQGTCDSKFKEEILRMKSPTLEKVIEKVKAYEIVENSTLASNGELRANKATAANY